MHSAGLCNMITLNDFRLHPSFRFYSCASSNTIIYYLGTLVAEHSAWKSKAGRPSTSHTPFLDSSAGSMNSQFTSLTDVYFIDLAKYFLLRCCKSVSTDDM